MKGNGERNTDALCRGMRGRCTRTNKVKLERFAQRACVHFTGHHTRLSQSRPTASLPPVVCQLAGGSKGGNAISELPGPPRKTRKDR